MKLEKLKRSFIPKHFGLFFPQNHMYFPHFIGVVDAVICTSCQYNTPARHGQKTLWVSVNLQFLVPLLWKQLWTKTLPEDPTQ